MKLDGGDASATSRCGAGSGDRVHLQRTVRRQYAFPGNDALGYGIRICDEVSRGETYADIMRDVKADVSPNDEFADNYLVSYAVGILCPAPDLAAAEYRGGCRPPA